MRRGQRKLCNVKQIEEISTNNSTSYFRFGYFGKLLTTLGISDILGIIIKQALDKSKE